MPLFVAHPDNGIATKATYVLPGNYPDKGVATFCQVNRSLLRAIIRSSVNRYKAAHIISISEMKMMPPQMLFIFANLGHNNENFRIASTAQVPEYMLHIFSLFMKNIIISCLFYFLTLLIIMNRFRKLRAVLIRLDSTPSMHNYTENY